MLIKVGDFEFTEVWDGVLYKKLSNYPQITDWEIRNLIEFMEYEKVNGRKCEIQCDNEQLLAIINQKIIDNPPHFHAEYNGHNAIIEIDTARCIKGALPSRQLKLILAWCVLHQDELMQNWELSKDGKPLNRINPLV